MWFEGTKTAEKGSLADAWPLCLVAGSLHSGAERSLVGHLLGVSWPGLELHQALGHPEEHMNKLKTDIARAQECLDVIREKIPMKFPHHRSEH